MLGKPFRVGQPIELKKDLEFKGGAKVPAGSVGEIINVLNVAPENEVYLTVLFVEYLNKGVFVLKEEEALPLNYSHEGKSGVFIRLDMVTGVAPPSVLWEDGTEEVVVLEESPD